MTSPARQRFDFTSYAMLEEDSAAKHEFLDGVAWAMAGGSPEHAALAMSVGRLLGNHLEGRPCRVFSSDLRIRVVATGLATYPDASVICGAPEIDPDDPKKHTVTNPLLLVEVLSPSTEEYDRGEKLSHYKNIPTLREVVLVAQDQRLVEVWTRDDDGRWTLREYRGRESARLASIDCALALDDVYRNPAA